MKSINIGSFFRSHASTLIFAGLTGAALSFFVLVFGSQAYSVQTDFLVIQKGAQEQDFYTLSKSVEHSGNVLKEAIASDLFLQEVIATGNFHDSRLSGNERDRLKQWRNSVKVTQRSSAGILEVTVLHNDQESAIKIAESISKVLREKNSLFRSGNSDSILIKSISGPIIERNPTVSKLIVGTAAGAIVGITLTLLYLLHRHKNGRSCIRGDGRSQFTYQAEAQYRKFQSPSIER